MRAGIDGIGPRIDEIAGRIDEIGVRIADLEWDGPQVRQGPLRGGYSAVPLLLFAEDEIDDPAPVDVRADAPTVANYQFVRAPRVHQRVGEDGQAVKGTLVVDGLSEADRVGRAPAWVSNTRERVEQTPEQRWTFWTFHERVDARQHFGQVRSPKTTAEDYVVC